MTVHEKLVLAQSTSNAKFCRDRYFTNLPAHALSASDLPPRRYTKLDNLYELNNLNYEVIYNAT